jgi:hypothetical protein
MQVGCWLRPYCLRKRDGRLSDKHDHALPVASVVKSSATSASAAGKRSSSRRQKAAQSEPAFTGAASVNAGPGPNLSGPGSSTGDGLAQSRSKQALQDV